MPPSVQNLVAFSCIFSNKGTFANYLGGLKLGCDLVGVDSGGVFDHALVKRAKAAVGKRAPPPRSKHYLILALVSLSHPAFG